MTKYFYCQSYQAFNLAIKLSREVEVVVITGSPNIIKACEYLKINYIAHANYRGFELVKHYNKVNNEIKHMLTIIGKNELHFSHTQFAVFCFILINEAVKKNSNIVFHDFEFVYTRVRKLELTKRNIPLFIEYKAIRRLYKIPIQFGMSAPGAYMICLDLQILKDKSITLIHDKNDYFNETIKLFKTIKVNTEQIITLFIAQTFDDSLFLKKDKIEEVLKYINNERIHIKMHPKIINQNILEKCRVLPTYLPVEFFFSGVKKCIVSFHSASLITASQFEHIIVISLLDIVHEENEFKYKVKEDLICKSRNRILFPQTVEEFRKLLYD